MKALLCKSFDGPESLVVEETADPEPAPGEVLVRVKAAALNFFDTLITRGKYQYKPKLPFSPGGEVAGIVERTGAGVTGLRPGDRVMGYLGWGGLAEKVAVKAGQLALIPDAVSDAAAAGLSVTYGTAIHGLKDRGRLATGETLAVLGASGGAGLAAVEIGRAMGARVIAAASSADKLAVCREHGAEGLINYAEQDLKEQLRAQTGGRGADVIYDCVGGPHAEAALRAIAWEGRYLVVGFAAGDIPRIPLNLVLLKACDVVGVFWGEWATKFPERNRENVAEVVRWVAEGRVKPRVQARYPLARAVEAIRLIEQRKAVGKIVVEM